MVGVPVIDKRKVDEAELQRWRACAEKIIREGKGSWSGGLVADQKKIAHLFVLLDAAEKKIGHLFDLLGIVEEERDTLIQYAIDEGVGACPLFGDYCKPCVRNSSEFGRDKCLEKLRVWARKQVEKKASRIEGRL